MTAQNYFDTYQGQSLLYAPAPKREGLRGQCVQSVCFYVAANGAPVLWVEGAKDWWDAAAGHPDKYERITNTGNAVPQPGDIVIWSGGLPGSGGYGHIDVCLQAYPGTGTFAGVDQNWGGKTVHKVTHNYNYVIGWLRIKSAQQAAAPAAAVSAPAPAVTPQGDEMIADTNQAHKAYQLLRPNGDGDDGEIIATAGRRSWAQFVGDAQGEVNARNANLRDQAQHMADMQSVIDSTNATVTSLRSTINDSQVSNTQKQTALDTALAQLVADNAQMTTLHDQVTDLQKKVADPLASASAALSDVAVIAKNKAGKSGGLLVAFFKFIMQLKLSKIFPKLKK